jgi:heme exporter protein C
LTGFKRQANIFIAMDTALSSQAMTHSGKRSGFLGPLAIALMVIALGLVFFVAPRAQDASGGQAQRIFYFHVSAAWVGFLSWFVCAFGGIAYLRTKNLKWDRLAVSAGEIGVLFLVMMLLSGMLWARPTWNAWWTWDYKLTLSLLQFLMFVAYLVLRTGIDNPQRRARFAAVYSVIGSITIPLNFIVSRVLENSVHPTVFGDSVNGRQQGGFGMAPEMRAIFYFCVLAFTVAYIFMLRRRVTLQERTESLAQRRAMLTME